MLLSIIDNFFTICSWWILPLLLVSWLLGSWFWNLTTGKKLRTNIEELETEVAGLKSEIVTHLGKINELETNYSDLRSKFATVEMNYFAEKETKENLELELNELKKKYLDE